MMVKMDYELKMDDVIFKVKSFDMLGTGELYEILRARADVFVGEEKILYRDPDGVDYESIHIFNQDNNGRITAYLRMYPKADEDNVVQLGRVLTRVQGKGLGTKLVKTGIKIALENMNSKEVYVESQKHAKGFYLKLGFECYSEEFIEAGIPHIQMRRKLDI